MLRTLLACAALSALSAPAFAADGAWGDGVELIAESEMDDLRGGFAVDGLDIGFGATVTTFVDGAPVLETVLTITDAGRLIEQTMSQLGENLAFMTPQERDALGIGGLNSADGLVIADASGHTAIVHNLADGALQNIIINTASGRDLRQEIGLTLTLPGFESIQDSIAAERFGLRIGDELRDFLPDAAS